MLLDNFVCIKTKKISLLAKFVPAAAKIWPVITFVFTMTKIRNKSKNIWTFLGVIFLKNDKLEVFLRGNRAAIQAFKEGTTLANVYVSTFFS